jgi:hypothetical protein
MDQRRLKINEYFAGPFDNLLASKILECLLCDRSIEDVGHRQHKHIAISSQPRMILCRMPATLSWIT